MSLPQKKLSQQAASAAQTRADNLHRHQIDDNERGELIAAWMELRQERKRTLADKPAQDAQVSKGGRGQKGGLSSAAQELGMPMRTVDAGAVDRA